MVLENIINEFRAKYGKPPAITAEAIEHEHCRLHCLYMANNFKVEHTPDYFLCGKAEIVGAASYRHSDEDTIRFLLYEKIANSPEHLKVLLESKYLAHWFYVNDYIGYLVIRGGERII
jgi:hypothetical protein